MINFHSKHFPDQRYCKAHLLTGEFRNVKTKSIIGRCHHKFHKGIITKDLLKEHDCLKKECPFLEKFENNQFWVQYEEEQKEKEKRKQAKKEHQNHVNNQIEKCNNIKKEIELIAKKYGYNFYVVDVKQNARCHYTIFYVSDKMKNDWKDFEQLIPILFASFNVYFRFTHIKDLDGNYVTIEEYEKRK
jgi:hypothetical protein